MTNNSDKITIPNQLRQACKYSHARWAAWLAPEGGAWVIQYHSGITKARHKWLETYLQEKNNIIWLAGALSHHRKRIRDTTQQSRLSGCKYLSIIPNSEQDRLLLVGTDSKDPKGVNFWKVIALQSPAQSISLSLSQSNPVLSPLLTAAPYEPIDHKSGSSQSLILIQTLKDFISRLFELAQHTNISGEGNGAGDLSKPTIELLHYYTSKMRTLTETRFALLKWKSRQKNSFPIPHALAQSEKPEFSTQVVDTDIELTGIAIRHIDQLEIVHQYLISIGEALWINDYCQWIGMQHPSFNADHISSNLDPAPEQFRWWSVGGIPLNFQQEIVGTLVIADDRKEKSFSPHDIALIELLAPLIGVAVGFARIQSELENRMVAQNQTETRLIRSARLAAVGEMAAGIAHELNNPLTTVTGFVELVLNELPADSSLHADLDLALSEALRARGIVRGLLDFSRPSQAMRMRTDMNDLISQVLNLIRHLLRINNLSVRLELRDDLPLVVMDPSKIQQVLLNLIQNAIRAMPSGGILTIRTDLPKEQPYYLRRETNDWVSISIQDTGIGIPAPALENIFEPFFTLPDNNSPEEHGVGLGLSVSLQIVQNHGGTIEVESTLNQGSNFTVFLPLMES